MGNLLLEANNLSKRFCRDPRLALRYTTADIFWEFRRKQGDDHLRCNEFWAVRDVNLELRSGEALGLIGHNGSGKSTLLNLLMGILRPTRGEIRWYTDRIVMIDPQSGLNPIQTGRENIYNKLSMHGIPEQEISKNVSEIIDRSEIAEFIDAPLGTYSTGMRLRLAFSIYTVLRPDVFIIDEALGGGDIRFREKFNVFLRNYRMSGGSIILVSHEPIIIQSLCDRCIALDHGQIYRSGQTEKVLFDYYELMQVKVEAQSFSMPTASRGFSDLIDITQVDSQYGSVQIVEVKILPLDADEIRPGGKVRFEIICNSNIELKNISASIMICQGEHRLALIHGGYGDRTYCLQIGYNQFSFTVFQLPCMPGNYQLLAAISLADTHALLAVKGVEDSPFAFSVRNYSHPVLQLSQALKTLIYLPAEWS
uniref:ABC transporter related n=1 Tax=Cyanothece sp. (strain PCC 7425 / ATCC 29141) TaxID=395961 RepID=B8HVF9_CYAP4